MSDTNDDDQGQNNGIEDLPSNKVLLADAAATRKKFYERMLDLVGSLPRPHNGTILGENHE